MIWRNPLAWIGLGALLVPIAVHLLVRMHARPVPFPSLRFLQTSRLAAVRRRALSDWPLLAVRLGIVALAVAALGDPFFLNDSRRAAWASRTTRAVIVDTTPSVDAAAAGEAAAREQASAFEATRINTADVRDGMTRGVAWLRRAAPAAREIVIVSDFQRDSLSESMLGALPSYVGLRFVRVGQPAPQRTVDGRSTTTSLANGQFTVRTPHVTIEDDRTQTQWAGAAAGAEAAPRSATRSSAGAPEATAAATRAGADASAPFAIALTPGGLSVDALGLRVQATEADRGEARAALDAVLSEGVPVSRLADRPLILAIGDAAQAMLKDGALPSLAAPWMADALNGITHDRLLRDVAANAAATRAAGNSDDPHARSAGALAGYGANAPSDASRRDTGATRGSRTDADAARGAARSADTSGARQGDTRDSLGPPLVVLRGAGDASLVIAGAARKEIATPSAETPSADGPSAASASEPRAPREAAANNALVLLSFAPASSDVTPLLMRAALRAIADPDPLPEAEVASIPNATLDAWRRPAALPPIDELTRVETHDRRWFWGGALALLAFETWLRRRMRRREPVTQEVAHAA
jgi:hypothetical protein